MTKSYVSNNKLTTAPDCFDQSVATFYLDASRNHITQVGAFKSATYLNLGYNKLTQIQADFVGQNLYTLH